MEIAHFLALLMYTNVQLRDLGIKELKEETNKLRWIEAINS